jgi:hypothetical protein
MGGGYEMRWLLIVTCLYFAGCATGPKTALTGDALESGYVVYFEQSDRVPKDVLISANNGDELIVKALGVISNELAGKIIDKMLETVPEITKGYGQERMFNAMLGRRMLFLGYDTPEQLREIQKIVESMSKAVEFVTPHDKTKGLP